MDNRQRLVSPSQVSNILFERARVGLDLANIAKQLLPLNEWWGPATADNPRLAYERFLDATRLAVELAYTRDGDAVGLYASQAYGDERQAFKFLVDFLRTAKWQKRLPRWWNPQHDLCMMRLAFNEDQDFYIYHAVEVKDVRKKWGYETTKLLIALAVAVYGEDGLKSRLDDLHGHGIALFMDQKPKRETGFEKGEGIPCRWGVECKRPDCWFQHPQLQLPKADTRMNDDPVCSSTNLRDHLVQLAGGEVVLEDLYVLYNRGIGVGNRTTGYRVSPSVQAESQKEIQKMASDGNVFAMYLLGKIWSEENIPVFGKLKSATAHKAETCRLWTASALDGNAYAMSGLALMHRDASHMPTAVHWWQRALKNAELPEAAYNLGVAYGLNEYEGSEAVPINYEQAAIYYAAVADMDLDYLKVDFSAMANSDKEDPLEPPLAMHIVTESPSNNEQLGFQTMAKSNLLTMEKYLGNPSEAPLPNNRELSPFLEERADSSCKLCDRRPRVGEKPMLKCAKCHIASYCNSICQRGHWPTHKLECGKAAT